MAKVFIEETTLTAIGDAIRGKEGTTELIPVSDMSNRITNLPSGGGAPTAEELTLTGICTYKFAETGWNWFIKKYGNMITTQDITNCSNMFYNNQQLEEIPFDINVKDIFIFNYMFAYMYKLKVCPRIRGTFKWQYNTTYASLDNMLTSCQLLSNLEDLFLPEMIDGFYEAVITTSYACPRPNTFQGMYSLRQVPSWWYKFKLNPESTAFPSNSYCLYYQAFQYCYNLDELRDIPIWKCKAASTTNILYNSFNQTLRLKSLTFETNPDGTPIEVQWKSQTIDLTNYVGYASSSGQITPYGITSDKLVKNDATYQALKNDPDWFTTAVAYSRYNHDSAVETINTLPDTSAYLATAGGTNTIKFKGAAGSNTDGGAINTLTEEEIAIATAKGWTVTFG